MFEDRETIRDKSSRDRYRERSCVFSGTVNIGISSGKYRAEDKSMTPRKTFEARPEVKNHYGEGNSGRMDAVWYA
jgi:hypothetical protein